MVLHNCWVRSTSTARLEGEPATRDRPIDRAAESLPVCALAELSLGATGRQPSVTGPSGGADPVGSGDFSALMSPSARGQYFQSARRCLADQAVFMRPAGRGGAIRNIELAVDV